MIVSHNELPQCVTCKVIVSDAITCSKVGFEMILKFYHVRNVIS